MHRWRYPSLSLHGIEGAFSDPGSKTVIPRKVIGKFSIRIVPDMTPDEVEKKVKDHFSKHWAARGSPNVLKAEMGHGGKAWTENPDHPHYVAARKATKLVYQVDPDLSREGGSIPVTLTFQEVTGKNVLLLPVGCGDDGAHSQNEKLDVRNYIQGVSYRIYCCCKLIFFGHTSSPIHLFNQFYHPLKTEKFYIYKTYIAYIHTYAESCKLKSAKCF